jgi:hypothetical protein
MHIKTIFVLESSWDDKNPLENSSVWPFVSEFAKQRRINAYYQVFTDRKSFCHWVNEFNKKANSASLLYIASHGGTGVLYGVNGGIKRTSIINAIKKARNLKYVHFGSCLFGNRDNLESILKKSKHIQWAAGYNKSVDWITSTLFDILLWGRITVREDHEKGQKTHTIVNHIAEKQAAGLFTELGFEYVYRYGNTIYQKK